MLSGRAGLVEGKLEGYLQLAEGRVGEEEMERTSVGNSVLKFGYERQEGAERAVAGGYLAYWEVCMCTLVCVCVGWVSNGHQGQVPGLIWAKEGQ